MMMEWPECSAGLLTGCNAGVLARVCSGEIIQSNSLSNRMRQGTTKVLHCRLFAIFKEFCKRLKSVKGRKNGPRTAWLQSCLLKIGIGDISIMSISLSGIAASASNSACNCGVNGLGLSFFIVLHLRGYYFDAFAG